MKPSTLHVPALTISASPRDTQENPLSSSPAWEARTSGIRSVASLQPCRMGATVNGPGSTPATRGGTFGALFITFNIDGDPRKAQGYFKNIDGKIIDTFVKIGRASCRDR